MDPKEETGSGAAQWGLMWVKKERVDGLSLRTQKLSTFFQKCSWNNMQVFNPYFQISLSHDHFLRLMTLLQRTHHMTLRYVLFFFLFILCWRTRIFDFIIVFSLSFFASFSQYFNHFFGCFHVFITWDANYLFFF